MDDAVAVGVRLLRSRERGYVRLPRVADIDGVGRVPVVTDMGRGRGLTRVEQDAEDPEDENDNKRDRRPRWEVKPRDSLPQAHALAAAGADISICSRLPAAPEVHRRCGAGGRRGCRPLATAQTFASRPSRPLPPETEPRTGNARPRALFRAFNIVRWPLFSRLFAPEFTALRPAPSAASSSLSSLGQSFLPFSTLAAAGRAPNGARYLRSSSFTFCTFSSSLASASAENHASRIPPATSSDVPTRLIQRTF